MRGLTITNTVKYMKDYEFVITTALNIRRTKTEWKVMRKEQAVARHS